MPSNVASGSTGRTATYKMSLALASSLESRINTDFSSESLEGKGISNNDLILSIMSIFRNKNI